MRRYSSVEKRRRLVTDILLWVGHDPNGIYCCRSKRLCAYTYMHVCDSGIPGPNIIYFINEVVRQEIQYNI